MTKNQKKIVLFISALAFFFGIMPTANAMHIMEGYLQPGYCIAWGVLCIPFLAAGYCSLQRTVKKDKKSITLIAMAGAFVFVISSLKIPSMTGSSSHMTGTGLGAILFGPAAVGILGIIVLIFQAVLLAHGGLTSLGANTFSMAIAGPVLSYAIFRLGEKCRWNRRVTVFLAAFAGDLFTYCVTSAQLALAHHETAGSVGKAFVEFLGVFAPTQLPLAVVEGLLTVMIVIGLETYALPELKVIGWGKEAAANE